MFISSDELITAYYEVLGSEDENVYNTDIFVLKGNNALGLEFYTPFQTLYDNVNNNFVNNAWSSIDVVATEDNTIINFELTNDAFNSPLRNFTITLNRGQTYAIRNSSRLAINRFDGSKITSNKPIAVTLKDDSIKRENNSSYDLVGDQIVPINLIGIEYIVFDGESIILATEDSTDIFVNGALLGSRNTGESLVLSSAVPAYITSSKPVYIFQLTQTSGEYGGALIPNISCTGSFKVNFNRATQETLTLQVLVKQGGQNHFLVNNNASIISATDFTPVTGTNGEWLQLKRGFNINQIPVQEISSIQNTRTPFHLGVINGSANTGSRYGYFSNFNILDLGVNFDACDNTLLEVDQGLDSYIWSTGDTTYSIQIDSSGLYWVKGTEGTCETTDTIEVIIKPGISFEMGSDTFFCGNPIELKVIDSVPLTYLWSTGDTLPFISVQDSGFYSLKITNSYDCFAIDSLFVADLTLFKSNINDTIICNNEILITLQNNENSNFRWFFDDELIENSTEILVANKQGYYVLEKQNLCGVITDTFYIEKRNILPPNIYTPNNDGINDNLEIEVGTGNWEFSLYNRWGKNIYNDANFKGLVNLPNINDGTYFYSLFDEYCNHNLKGWITVVK